MTRLLLTRVTKMKGRLTPEQIDEDQMRRDDNALISVELSECGTTLTCTYDADKVVQNQVDEGYLPYKLPLMVMINNWRKYNQLMRQYVLDNKNTYYRSKQLYWRFDYS